MKRPQLNRIFLFLLAIIFSAGLIFASIELPFLADKWIQHKFNFPGFDQQSSTLHISKAELYFQHLHLNLIGYISLVVLFSIIIIGLLTNKLKLSALGTFALFIPIFGHFTVTMFFLAGLGFLRFLWIPFTDISPIFMHLGDLLLLPHHWLIRFGNWIHIDLHQFLSVFLIAAGVLIFVFGVFAWFNTKLDTGNVVHSKIYKLSRHPQYLGWIIWSYGLYLLPVDAQKRSWSYPDSMPLLLTIMIIILISFFEEFKMSGKYGQEYLKFKSKTAFMFPLPDGVKRRLKYPLKLLYGRYQIDTKGKSLVLIGFHTLLIMVGSYIYLTLTQPAYSTWLSRERNERKIDEYILLLADSEERRQKDIAAMNISEYGNLALQPLLDLLKEGDQRTNSMVARTLGEIGDSKVCSPIYEAYKNGRIVADYELIMTIGNLKCYEFEEEMLAEILDQDSRVKSYASWYLGQIKSSRAASLLIADYRQQETFTKIAYLEALGKIADIEATSILISELYSQDRSIVEAAIVGLSNFKSTEAIEALKKFPMRSDWEIRIYADAAIKRIED